MDLVPHPDAQQQHTDGRQRYPIDRRPTPTQWRYRQCDSVASSQVCLDGDITPQLAVTGQHCRQYRLSSIIASTTRLHHHQAKQHPRDEDLILHAAHGQVRFNKDHCPPCTDQGRKSLSSSYFIIFSIFICRSDQLSH
jgi:hypothetical protein